MFRYAILCTMALIMLFSVSLVFAHSGGQAKAFFAQKPPELDGKVDDEFQEHWDEYQACRHAHGCRTRSGLVPL